MNHIAMIAPERSSGTSARGGKRTLMEAQLGGASDKEVRRLCRLALKAANR